MFERRIKIFLIVLIVIVTVLLGRAMQLQVWQREHWRELANASMHVEVLADTTRGRILDFKGAVLAEDEPCIDACVDYRLITEPPEANLIAQMATKRARERYGVDYTRANSEGRRAMVQSESELLKTQIQLMWEKLARLTGQPIDEINARRKAIQDRVEMRRRVVWYQRYRNVQDHASKEEPPWYRKWIMGDQTDAPDIDDVSNEPLKEELVPHVLIEAIDKIITPDGTSLQNELDKHADEYLGLSLRPSTHRAYPYGAAACHVIGHLGKVWKEDMVADPNFADDLRAYGPNDLKGRDGLEALGEPTLRGRRGRTVSDGVTNQIVSSEPPIPGGDLRTTLDIDLQSQIQNLFTHVDVPWEMKGLPADWEWDHFNMHGAAVVIEIETGDVRALVSSPGFDLNDLDKQYPVLLTDKLNSPLLNRATQAMLEPGSTVKPMVGAGAITDGLIDVNTGIECTGFLQIGGRVYKGFGKCWTYGTGKANSTDFSHHPFPSGAPHRGHDGNADGFLTYADAIERSCNIFFETTADKLGMDGLSKWMERFGLGRPTGIGIAEARGRLPSSFTGPNKAFATWTAGIGQGPVAATPLQMCNVAATIARRGIWVRPNLVQNGQLTSPFRPKGAEGNPVWTDVPSRLDLHLAPSAVDAAIDGMKRVVNSRAGTGTLAMRNDMIVAGKTGTAQATAFSITKDLDGEMIRQPLTPATHWDPQPEHEWYRAIDKERSKLNHAWFIGFVPADNPKYAVSVMVEYGGGGGGVVAGPIAKKVIDALVEHGYLHPRGKNPQ